MGLKEKTDQPKPAPAPGGAEMDSIAVMAGRLAHEIKNPLNVIYMNLQLLQEEWQDPATPKERRLLQKIEILKQEAQRLRDTLDDFLRFARPGTLRLEAADLNTVVEEVVDFVRPDAVSRDIRILTSFFPRPLDCNIDRDLFKQALLNIFLNAQQAIPDAADSPGGAPPSASLAGGARDILVKTSLQKGLASIDVSDTGVGIPPDVLPKIFDAFYSTKASGSGLGLPTTKRIIEAHGGIIEVFSTVGKGTSFRITLAQAETGGGQ